MADFPTIWLVSSLGFGLGMAFGATAQRTDFCTMGAISDIVFMGNWNRFRAWLLAMAVAMIGSQFLHMGGLIDINKSIYTSPNLAWAGAIIGGLMFGFGMTMTGGCGNKTLVRLGAGNLKSLIVAIVLGLFAYMTLRGLTGLARVEIEGATNIDLAAKGLKAAGIPDLISALTGMAIETARPLMLALFAGGILIFCFKDGGFRTSKHHVASGIILGALVVTAWYVTGVIGNDEFEPTPLNSFTFVNPVGESLQYLMTFTGSTINFGIAVVGGIIFGAFIAAKASGTFRIESFVDAGDMAKHIIGAAIMGIGGIMAMGCTIGQGITGMSTLAFASLIAFVSICAGGVYGMKYLEEGSFSGALKAMFETD